MFVWYSAVMHLSVCLICHDTPDRRFLLQRALNGWLGQTVAPYEVIVAWDGEVPREFASTALVQHLSVPKTQPRANRNGARNGAAKVATGTHLWFVDGDFIPEPTAVEHAQIALQKQDCALSPVLVSIRTNPVAWQRNPDLSKYGVLADQWSGFAKMYRPNTPGLTQDVAIPEGFPLLRKDVFWELGGFDETYLGWGANKEEFVDRLRALQDFYPYKLLASTRMHHQPHLPEDTKESPSEETRANQQRREEAARSPNLINLAGRVRILCGF